MLDLLQNRRSIRKYQNRKIDSKNIGLFKEALLRCPTSRNINPWEFIFVDDPILLEKLSLSKQSGSSFLKDAPLGIVICGDESKSDVWIEDCSIASITVQYAAHSLNMGSCWIQIRNRTHNKNKTSEEYIQKLLKIPKNIKVESIIGVGFPAEEKKGHPKNNLNYSKIHFNKYK